MGRMWPCVMLLLLLGSARATTPALDATTTPGLEGSTARLDGSITARLDGSVPPGLDGSVPPGLDGSVPPRLDGGIPLGLDGSIPLWLDGSMTSGLNGSVPAGLRLDGSVPPGLDGSIPPKLNISTPPARPWRWPITYLEAIKAAIKWLNQRSLGTCTLRLRGAQPQPGRLRVPQRPREVSFVVEDAGCPPAANCRSCHPGALQRCVGTMSPEQQPPVAELRCEPLRAQPLRRWWPRVREWRAAIRQRWWQHGPARPRGRPTPSST
ncbi:CTHB1 protein, partial [Penelope pileata]|nr:CTHB1 protein [Penelope pileata]